MNASEDKVDKGTTKDSWLARINLLLTMTLAALGFDGIQGVGRLKLGRFVAHGALMRKSDGPSRKGDRRARGPRGRHALSAARARPLS